MSKDRLVQIRPYICGSCRLTLRLVARQSLRAQSSTTSSASDNVNPVERRIAALGGRDAATASYGRLSGEDKNGLLSAETFANQFAVSWRKNKRHGAGDGGTVAVWGRVTSIRTHGRKLAFVNVTTGGSSTSVGRTAQVMISLADLPIEEKSQGVDDPAPRSLKDSLGKLQRGDWISVRGTPEESSSGEFQIRAKQLPVLLAPALQTVPEVLSDSEVRMRNRHADQIVNPSARDMIFMRHRLLSALRRFLHEENFIEVNTPLIGAGAGGASARPFETVATEFSDRVLNLRVAPELYLKRLIVGGMHRVYEIGTAFRNEGVDATHNPEFTICEFYGAMLNLEDLMTMTQTLFKTLAHVTSLHAGVLRSVSKPDIEFEAEFARIEFIPTLQAQMRVQLGRDWRFPSLDDPEAALDSLKWAMKDLFLPIPTEPTLPRLLDSLAGHFLEPLCDDPTFIVHQPECMAPLAKSFVAKYHTSNKPCAFRVSARAELFIRGREYVNCYEEENSPIEQRRKLEQQITLHRKDAQTSGKAVDESFIHALEWGMPPTGGWGCGFDRIVMLFGGRTRIADVLPFGTLRNVVGLGSVPSSRELASPAQSPTTEQDPATPAFIQSIPPEQPASPSRDMVEHSAETFSRSEDLVDRPQVRSEEPRHADTPTASPLADEDSEASVEQQRAERRAAAFYQSVARPPHHADKRSREAKQVAWLGQAKVVETRGAQDQSQDDDLADLGDQTTFKPRWPKKATTAALAAGKSASFKDLLNTSSVTSQDSEAKS